MPEDFEAIALGLQSRNKKKRAPLAADQHIPLSQTEMALLSQAKDSALYHVLLKIFESITEKLETHHMQSWSNEELFQRTGLIAVASRFCFEAWQQEVLYQISEYDGLESMAVEESKAKNMGPDEYVRKQFGIER